VTNSKIPPVSTQKFIKAPIHRFKPGQSGNPAGRAPMALDAANIDAGPPPPRLIDKQELLRRIPVSYPTIWKWMQAGNFPRARNLGGKTGWLETDVDEWIKARPVMPIKGDDKAVTS
jgi:predicted DNA-binding transcriptional regulator AlpA